MKIKYEKNGDKRVGTFNKLIESKFPKFLDERNPDLYLVAGGDGAMLHVINKTIDSHIPYFGKALGSFNFLLNNFDNDEEILNKLIKDEIKLDILKPFTLSVYLNEKKIGEAVNDIVIGDNIMDYHTFNITTQGKELNNFEIKGGGICISTPIGSTAYNFNNNGRILPLESSLISITGIVCNRYLNDIFPVQEIKITGNGGDIYLSNVISGKLTVGKELIIKRGEGVEIGFLNKDEFLKRRTEILHRYRK
ncbi:MAG: hypothetical protein PHE21_03875 [Candidatus Dojkabacteria bacterium]|nr:hypothetical protein [Candidatus Dojkabacteria bacterium]